MAFKYKRKNSPYWWIGFNDPITRKKGKPFSSKIKNERLAEQYLKDFEKKLRTQEVEFLHEKEAKLTVSHVYELFKQDRANTEGEFNSKTIQSYDIALNKYFYPACSDKLVSQYSRADYHKFVNSMSALSQNSRAIYTKRIYALFRWMVLEKYIKENPMKRVKEEEKQFEILTRDELNKILEYTETKTKFIYLVKFLLLSAFRIQEALNFRGIDIKKNVIDVKGKGSKYSFIVITQEMREFLSGCPMPADLCERVFPYQYKAIQQFWTRMRKVTGIKKTIHDLRKYCLSEFANSGVPINFTKDYARHSSINTTMKYYVRSDKQRMVEEIDQKVSILQKK